MEKSMDEKYKLFIDGKWVEGKEGKTFNTYSPINGKLLATCVDAGKEDIDLAVKAAWKAFETWKDVSIKERSNMMLKVADIIEQNAQRLATIETLDNGKPYREALYVDIPTGPDQFRYYAAALTVDEGRAAMVDKNTLSLILKEPIGVVGQIGPWNFPFGLATWKIAPALAAGCTIVMKPSSETPISILEFAKLIQSVLPPGVFNVVTGKGSTTGNYLIEHPDIRKLSFTGSTDTGYIISAAAAKKLIPVTLEMGGKSANIYFPDIIDWEKAIEGVLLGILFNQGQTCSAGSRVFVHEEIYDKFLADCIEAFERINVGHPMNMETQMGALISETQLQKVLSYVEIGKKEGAKVACGGYRITDGELAKGYFMKPTILTNVNNKMRIAREEIFGPVVCFIKFKDESEVIEMANDSDYGLAGGVWTKDINRAIRVARAIDAGKMWVNCYNTLPPGAPWGGVKKTGFGRENHTMTLDSYCQVKNIMINLSVDKTGLY
jgi:aldehyde dehydrogenase (NAD+)